ncbi:MAG TPA: response regulator [Gemmatimonadales bacterium]|nr:response regulator [Gemmatimonadales bacterium]
MAAARTATLGPAVTPVVHPDDMVQILLVDDQPANLEALQATLETTGCRFVLARSADEALLALLDQDFAAIVLDVMMPGMSGFDLATMIKRRHRTQQVPILFLTARMLDKQDELKGYAVGAVDYLTKPIDPQILRAKIAVFIDLYRKRRALAKVNIELQRQISERQKIADELKRSNDVLEQRVSERTATLAEANRRKDEFLATLAHELRTPLSALRTAAEALRLKAGEHADVLALQGIVERQTHQLTRLTNDLLDISRITRDKLALQTGHVVLSEVIATAVETVRPFLDQRNAALIVELTPNPVYLNGDFSRLVQVFVNLLDNAARYSPKGARITIFAQADTGGLLVKVTDNGSGIDRALMPFIFDPFVHGERSSAGEGGLGVGLALARRLIEMHGGMLTAYSAGPGCGAEFTVRLPVVGDVLPEKRAKPSARATGTLPYRRVLVVEDNEDTAAMMKLMLTEWGQETRLAHDGPTALQVAAEFRPDVVLLDIGLPKLHGYEVARQIRHQPWGRSVMLIAVTGWGAERDRHSEAAGIDHRLLKPVDPAVLRDLLARAGP